MPFFGHKEMIPIKKSAIQVSIFIFCQATPFVQFFPQSACSQASGADPGFPVGGGANPLAGGGGVTYDCAKISIKLHEIEKILGRGGDHEPGAPPYIRHWAYVYVFDDICGLITLCDL